MADRLLILCLLVCAVQAAPVDESKPLYNSGKDDLQIAASDSYLKRSPEYNNYGATGINGNGIGVGYDGYGNTLGYDSSRSPTQGYYGGGFAGGFGGGYAPRQQSYGGAGGYGAYSGNGGLNSYLGYYNPYYQGANHLGYGYYNRDLKGFGSIYNNGIAPNLVTGYRGYSRR